MIKNIIFDFGNVLIKGRGRTVLDPYTDDEDIKDYIYEKIFKSQDWYDYDMGYVTIDDLYHKLIKKFSEEFHKIIWQILYDSPKNRKYNEEICALIRVLKANGYKIYALSNIHISLYEQIKNSEIGKYFDGYVISSVEHLAKPDENIYKKLFEKFNIKPEESFFIDDKEKNIIASRNLGMEGNIFNYEKYGMSDLEKDFQKYKINYK